MGIEAPGEKKIFVVKGK